jgi:hypothetical protein
MNIIRCITFKCLSILLVTKLYLENTDFYYARKLETGQDVPNDVVTKRISTREYIKNNDTLELRSEYEIILSAKNI